MKLLSEAVYGVVTQPADRFTGEFFYDEEILEMLGVSLDPFKREAPAASMPVGQDKNYNSYTTESDAVAYESMVD